MADVFVNSNQVASDTGVDRGAASPVTSTTSTAPGVIAWSVGSDGALHAQCSGQQLAITSIKHSDGSLQGQEVFSQIGQTPYLTITSLVQYARRSISLTIAAGPSKLTVAITGIDQDVRLGTATVSGSLLGKVVSWTGSVDLSTNPLVGNPIGGWPANAFAAELATASVFAPLAYVVTASEATPGPFPAVTSGARSGLHADSVTFGVT